MPAPTRPSLKSESGAMLIEIVVSVALFSVVALAVLAGIDGAARSTGREKARSVAATVAEQDQERMRSLQMGTLSNAYDVTRTVSVDGAQYTVRSTARWVEDNAGGSASCASGSGQADYLQITSEVTSGIVGTRIAPVKIDSFFSPGVAYSSTRGTLAVQVNNRAGVGVPNVPVSVAGPTTASGTTNASGCALFQYIPAGTYTASVGSTSWGWVDRAGNPVATQNPVVTTGNLVLTTVSYDQAATATVQAITTYPGAASNGTFASKPTTVSLTHSSERGMHRTFPSGTTAVTATGLFPFTSQYAVYTGACTENDPGSVVGSTYWTTNAGVTATPGGTHSVTIREAPLGIQVLTADSKQPTQVSPPGSQKYGGNGTVVTRITAKPVTGAGCTPPVYELTTATNPRPPSGFTATTSLPDDRFRSWVSESSSAFDPGLPYGRYAMCFYAKAPDGTTFVQSATYNNNRTDGPATPTVVAVNQTAVAGC